MTTHQKNSLTEWPDNLKEVIDWFLRVGGNDPESKGNDKKSELKDAVKSLNGFTQATQGLGEFHIEGLFNKVNDGLQAFIGYSGDWKMTEKGIGQNFGSSYASSYSTLAKWGGWKAGEENANTAAKIFLYTMPLLYYGITYTFWQCTRGKWKNQTIPGDHNGWDFYTFLLDMGYNTDKLKNGCKGHDVMTIVGGVIDELQNASASSSYPEFLHNLQENGKSHLTSRAYNYSLYALYATSHAYLQSKTKSSIQVLPEYVEDVDRMFTGYSAAINTLNIDSQNKLSTAYKTLFNKIKAWFSKAPDAPPSPAGPVAGTLATLGLGAGAAATYLFNLGCAKTLINGLLRIG